MERFFDRFFVDRFLEDFLEDRFLERCRRERLRVRLPPLTPILSGSIPVYGCNEFKIVCKFSGKSDILIKL